MFLFFIFIKLPITTNHKINTKNKTKFKPKKTSKNKLKFINIKYFKIIKTIKFEKRNIKLLQKNKMFLLL